MAEKIHIFEYVACMCPIEYDGKVSDTFRLIHSYEQGKCGKTAEIETSSCFMSNFYDGFPITY